MAAELTGSADGDQGIPIFDSEEEIHIVAERNPKSKERPGKRPKNPLGFFSSYTYQLSLYMVTPQGYNEFIASGRKNIVSIKDGIYLVAQTGGINNIEEKRAKGFNFDYYLDNLRIETVMNTQSAGSASFSTTVNFTVTEPYGFSFISNLRRSLDAINSEGNDNIPSNPTNQFYVLGIRFFGYDAEGKLVNGSTLVGGNPIDLNAATSNSVFERYLDITITAIKFKIDGKATVYNIEAVSTAPSKSFSITRGVIDKNFTASNAVTVQDVLTELMADCTKQQEEVYANSNHGPLTKYEVKFIGPDSSLISEASMVTPDDIDKTKSPGSDAESTAESNAATEVKTDPKLTEKNITIKQGTPILQAIHDVIATSSFAKNALKVLYENDLEPNSEVDEVDTIRTQAQTKVIKWFNCSSEIKNISWVNEANDWAYTIVYLIQTYETPMTNSAVASSGIKYYGPYKKYEYWYTGQNSEILSYSQTLDNTYYNVVLTDVVSTTDSTVVAGKVTDQSRFNTKGATAEAVNNYVTSLFDPSAQAQATIQILGDPDLLCPDSIYSEEQLYSRFYGPDGYTINPTSGQAFIEIDFKEAVDYSMQSGSGINAQPGTLSINDSIMFWQTPGNNKRSGLVYMLLTVSSSFASGKFSQTLTGVMPSLDMSTYIEDEGREDTKDSDLAEDNAGPASGDSNSGLGNNNLMPDKTVEIKNKIVDTIKAARSHSTTVSTKNGQVADDDA